MRENHIEPVIGVSEKQHTVDQVQSRAKRKEAECMKDNAISQKHTHGVVKEMERVLACNLAFLNRFLH